MYLPTLGSRAKRDFNEMRRILVWAYPAHPTPRRCIFMIIYNKYRIQIIVKNDFFLVTTERSQNFINIHLGYKQKCLSGLLACYLNAINIAWSKIERATLTNRSQKRLNSFGRKSLIFNKKLWKKWGVKQKVKKISEGPWLPWPPVETPLLSYFLPLLILYLIYNLR